MGERPKRMTVVDDALPCPWCGSKPYNSVNRVHYDGNCMKEYVYLTCSGCEIDGPQIVTGALYELSEQEHDAVVAWNTRGRENYEQWEADVDRISGERGHEERYTPGLVKR